VTWGEIPTLIDNLNWRVSSLVPISGTDVTNPKRHLTPWSLLGITPEPDRISRQQASFESSFRWNSICPRYQAEYNLARLPSIQLLHQFRKDLSENATLHSSLPSVFAPSSSAHPRTSLRHEPQRNGLANAPKTTRSSTERTQTTFKLKPRNRL
jgi:hypothetical protein